MKRLRNIVGIWIVLISVVAAQAATLREHVDIYVDSAYNAAMGGHIPEAICINEDGLALVPEDSVALRCEFYSCLLYCYHRLGDYEQALKYGELCLEYDEQRAADNNQSPITNHQSKADLSASLGNLAGVYSSAGKHEVAIAYLERAITLENELLATDTTHSPKSLAIRKAMLGEVLVARAKEARGERREANDLERALQLTEEALEIERQLGRRPQEGMRLAQLANIYDALGQTARAKEYNRQALVIARETGNKPSELIILLQLGQLHEAVELAQALGMKKQEFEAADRLYKQSANRGQYSEALKWLERARVLHDEIQSDESQRQLSIAQVRYDTFRKERQLAEQQLQLKQRKMREWILIIITVLVLLIVILLTFIVLLLRKRKNILEQKVLDQEQQYNHLALELRQFYGKDISTLLQEIADAKAKKMKETKLTKREQEIVRLLCEGYRGKEIADILCISIRAVNSHKTNIFNKLNLTSSVELVRFALEHGII